MPDVKSYRVEMSDFSLSPRRMEGTRMKSCPSQNAKSSKGQH